MPDNNIVDNPDDMELLNSVLPDDVEEQVNKGVEDTELEDDELDSKDAETPDEIELDTSPIKTTYRAVKEKYPDLFKDFPDLRSVIFRDQTYSKIFPTVEDAQEAVEDVNAFNSLRESTLAGDPNLIVDTLSNTDKAAFTNFSRNFLPALHKKDPSVYGDTVAPVIQNILRYAFDEGVARAGHGDTEGGDKLKEAAKMVAKVIFGDEGAADGSKNFVKALPKVEVDTVKEGTEYNAAVKDVTTNVLKELHTSIRRGLDPNGVLTPFIRKSVISNVIDQVQRQLAHDASWMQSQAARWARAKREGYDDGSKRKITTAYLARAKDLIPTIRRKIVEEAIGSSKKNSSDRVIKIKESSSDRKELTTSARRQNGNNTGRLDTSKPIDWSKTSDDDLMNGKITYRS